MDHRIAKTHSIPVSRSAPRLSSAAGGSGSPSSQAPGHAQASLQTPAPSHAHGGPLANSAHSPGLASSAAGSAAAGSAVNRAAPNAQGSPAASDETQAAVASQQAQAQLDRQRVILRMQRSHSAPRMLGYTGLRNTATLALTALSGAQHAAEAFGVGPLARGIGRQVSQTSASTPLRRQDAGALLSNAGHTNGPPDKSFDDFSDLGPEWIGDVPDAGGVDPNAFMARFKGAAGEGVIEAALTAHGHMQTLEAGLAQLQGAAPEQIGYQDTLDAASGVCQDLVKLMCESLAEHENVPAVAALDVSVLAQVDAAWAASGNEAGRLAFLQRTHQTYAACDKAGSLHSQPGKMLSGLLEPIMQTIQGPTATAPQLKETLFPLLDRLQKMHEKEAGLATLAGQPDRAAQVLQQCLDGVLAAKLRVSFDDAARDSVTLTFDLLKAQVQANGDECVGTLETLYMQLNSYAEHFTERFPANYPAQGFMRKLDTAYDAFLSDLENNRLLADLRHPIARLFIEAEQRGIFGA